MHGLATAAAVWTTGAIGASVAYGAYALAIALSVLDVFTLLLMERLGKRLRRAVHGEATAKE